MSSDAIIGFLFGLLSSLLSGIVLFWLQGRRDSHREAITQRREDTRVARNWTQDGKKASLRGFDLTGANLSGKDLSGADLEDCNLEGAQMWETDFTGANLIRANFENAELIEAKLCNSKLHLANFDNAVLRGVDFSGAKLRRTRLLNARVIQDCIWTNARVDETTEIDLALRQVIDAQKFAAQ